MIFSSEIGLTIIFKKEFGYHSAFLFKSVVCSLIVFFCLNNVFVLFHVINRFYPSLALALLSVAEINVFPSLLNDAPSNT